MIYPQFWVKKTMNFGNCFDVSGADDEEFFSAEEDGDHWTEHVEHTENSSLWKAQPRAIENDLL
jgi:hypothetical protein